MQSDMLTYCMSALFEFSTPTETIPFPSAQTQRPRLYTQSHTNQFVQKFLFLIDAFLVLYRDTLLAQALCSLKVLIV